MNSLNGKSILLTIEEICAFGTRWMGSEGAEKTIDYVVREFEKAGLMVELQPFRYPHYQPLIASLLIDGKSISCQPIALSLSTEKPLKANLKYGGQCTSEDLRRLNAAGVDFKNTIVLSDNLRSFVAYPEVEAAGAAGFISISNLIDNTIRCGSARLDGKLGTIPAIAIGGTDGRDVISLLSKEGTLCATLQLQGKIEEMKGQNIIATHPDAEPPKILLTAHYDCFWNGVMAMDNCAGIAAVVALSRAFTPAMRKKTEFVVFGAEELGCWGSGGYVLSRCGSIRDIMAILNLDTFGSNRSGVEIGVTKNLEKICRKAVEERGFQVDCWNIPPRAASDHQKFIEQGFSAIWIANGGTDPRYHTPLDVPSEMSEKNLETITRLAYSLAEELFAVFG